jgi:hypothetical protein
MVTKIDEYGGWRGLIVYTLLSSLISGAVVGGILKWTFDKELESWKATRSWQTSALTEIIAPAVMHFGRTDSLAERYRTRPKYGEALFLQESNSTIRALLLTKSHLLPSSLVRPSQCLLTHYDIWLKRFDLTLDAYRAANKNADPSPDEKFDVGFSIMESVKCGGFPKEVPSAFQAECNQLRRTLFDMPPTP